jgi:hypothetical protein
MELTFTVLHCRWRSKRQYLDLRARVAGGCRKLHKELHDFSSSGNSIQAIQSTRMRSARQGKKLLGRPMFIREGDFKIDVGERM